MKLSNARVVVAGVGGLGCPASVYLAAAGIGGITLVDGERVEPSNLNRQILFADEDVGEPKVAVAARKLAKLNPSVTITPLLDWITPDNARQLVAGANLVIDGMDNFETRFAINAACVAEGVPFIHAGIYGMMGQLTAIVPGKTPCLACIYPGLSEKRRTFPVIGATPGVMAGLQVAEAVKLIAGFGELLAGRMLMVDLERMQFSTLPLGRRQECPVCGHLQRPGMTGEHAPIPGCD